MRVCLLVRLFVLHRRIFFPLIDNPDHSSQLSVLVSYSRDVRTSSGHDLRGRGVGENTYLACACHLRV